MKWISAGVMTVVLAAALLAAALPQQKTAQAGAENGYYGKKAKYVFFFIGDGLATPQINSAEIYKGTQEGSGPMAKGRLNLTGLPHLGVQTTQAANTFITESAAAGTALATGNKTNNDILGMDPSKTKKFKSMAEMAKEKGMKVGIVSTVSLDHATPGAFYAHEPTRNNYYEIGLALANSGFDYFAGGGLLAPTGKQKDRPDVLEIARKNGYQVVNDAAGISALSKNSGKVIAIAP